MEGQDDKEKALEEYKSQMKTTINPKNLQMYMDAFHNRSDITPQLKEGLKCDALVVVGNKTSHVHAAEYMHSHMDKVSAITIIKKTLQKGQKQKMSSHRQFNSLFECKVLNQVSN